MKFAKMSLAAIMAMGIAANAADIKVDGSVKLNYGTNDATQWSGALATHNNAAGDLFDQTNSYANAAVRLGLTAENMPGDLTGRLSVTWLDTFGLENRVVADTWAGSEVGSQLWIDEAYLKGTVFDKTTIIAGRQYLDTPLVFSEKWNIVSNSYDAAIIVDQHFEKTALVAGWIWSSNVNGSATVNTAGGVNKGFSGFVDNGAYAFGAITSLIPMTTAQAWYYSVDSVADAYWLQADVTPDMGSDFKLELGGQFAGTMVADSVTAGGWSEDATVWALKIGGEINGFKLSGAYSSSDKGNLGFANVAGAQSKLYTEAWWNYGFVSMPDTDAYNVTAEYSWADVADFGAYYTHTEFNGNDGHAFLNGGVGTLNIAKDDKMDEFALVASKTFGAFDTSVAYIYTDADNLNKDANGKADSFNTLQVYLTYNF